MWVRVTEWPTVTPPASGLSSERQKFFFHLSDLNILNSYVLHSSYGGKQISHRDFPFSLVRNILENAGPERRGPRPLGRTPKVEKPVVSLEVCGRKYWHTRLRRN